MFLLCKPKGSRFSTRGEGRRSNALDGDAALKGLDMAEIGVGKAPFTSGERRDSIALDGVFPPDVSEAGVINCVRLDLDCRTRGAGEPRRSKEGDFGGTSGGFSTASGTLLVSTFKAGLTLGLRIGDSGLPSWGDGSRRTTLLDSKGSSFPEGMNAGPVTHAIKASPKGPALHAEPGALLDRS
jgi:hypothetical protein